MGLHRHVRVCNNGMKSHSTGTWNDDIYTSLLRRSKDKNYNRLTWIEDCAAFNNKGFSTFIFIKRHNKHQIRTIEKIVTVTSDNEFHFVEMNDVFDLGDPIQKSIYKKLSKYNLFDTSAFRNSLTPAELSMIKFTPIY